MQKVHVQRTGQNTGKELGPEATSNTCLGCEHGWEPTRFCTLSLQFHTLRCIVPFDNHKKTQLA